MEELIFHWGVEGFGAHLFRNVEKGKERFVLRFNSLMIDEDDNEIVKKGEVPYDSFTAYWKEFISQPTWFHYHPVFIHSDYRPFVYDFLLSVNRDLLTEQELDKLNYWFDEILMARKLSDSFVEDFKGGSLKKILEWVKSDHTLEFNIRDNYVNIYYRGGNILRIREKAPGKYTFWFDENYKGTSPPSKMEQIQGSLLVQDWDNFFPFAKQAMDFYFADSPKEEREFAQLVVRDNNYSGIANGTDYFIIDYEYDNHQGARFDLVALEWPSNAVSRKQTKKFKPRLVVMEMKFGDGAFKGSAGMVKHVKDFIDFSSNPGKVSAFKREMVDLFKQKRALGLIKFGPSGNSNPIDEFDEMIEMLFLIANHDPESRVLKKVLLDIKTYYPEFDIKVITSSFLGYGLYNHRLKTLTPELL
ncbi:MAG: hypothetical protein WCO93_00810 [bacterium]